MEAISINNMSLHCITDASLTLVDVGQLLHKYGQKVDAHYKASVALIFVICPGVSDTARLVS